MGSDTMRPAGVNQRALTMGVSQTTNRGVERPSKALSATDEGNSSVKGKYPAPCVGSSPSPKSLPAFRPDIAAPWKTRPREDAIQSGFVRRMVERTTLAAVSAVARRHSRSSAVMTRVKPKAQPRLARKGFSASCLRKVSLNLFKGHGNVVGRNRLTTTAALTFKDTG